MNEEQRARFKGWSKRILKLLGWGVFVFILLGVVGNTVVPRLERYLAERSAAKLRHAYEEERRGIEEMYRSDTSGGTTPEETFDMLIDALKKGDIERASSYYELSVRERAREGLEKESREHGNFNQSIKYFVDVRGGEKECNEIEKKFGGCTFEYSYITDKDETVNISGTNDKIFIPKGSKERKIADFQLNHYSRIWKITQPY